MGPTHLTAALCVAQEAAPAIFARRAAVEQELEAVLAAAERFESGEMAAALGFEPSGEAAADGGEADGGEAESEAAALDARLLQTALHLSGAQEEVDGQLQALSQFTEAVRGATTKATERRDSAQRALELLAAEQRRASAEMKISLDAALQAMEQMQGQWDAAVADNAAELQDLKTSSAAAAERQQSALAGLERMRQDLARETDQLGALTEERRSLVEENGLMRKRYVQLRQRRLRQQNKGGFNFAGVEVDLEGVAGAAGASAEKAASALLSLFAKKTDDEPPADQKSLGAAKE